jgi:hypothetical protein
MFHLCGSIFTFPDFKRVALQKFKHVINGLEADFRFVCSQVVHNLGMDLIVTLTDLSHFSAHLFQWNLEVSIL